MVARQCSQCGQSRPRTKYSNNQWNKGENNSRCKQCVGNGNGNGNGNGKSAKSVRKNISHRSQSSNSSAGSLVQITETMARISLIARPSVEHLDHDIKSLNMVMSFAKHDRDMETFHRLRELRDEIKAGKEHALVEREKELEEKRVSEVIKKWQASSSSSKSINVDDEETACAKCQDFLPINDPNYKRLFCCAARICQTCIPQVLSSLEKCPFCNDLVNGQFRDEIMTPRKPWDERPNGYKKWLHFASKPRDKSWAQVQLGRYYKYGLQGVPKDAEKCLYWIQRAAEKGNPDAYTEMAELHIKGFGVPKSDAQVKKWTMMAADAGDPLQQYLAGKMNTMKDYGRNDERSVYYLTLAASQGNAEAQCLLGEFIFDGHIIHSDAPKHRSLYWFEKAFVGGCDRAADYLLALFEGHRLPYSATGLTFHDLVKLPF